MDDVEIHESLDEQIASSLSAAQNAPINEKLRHLKKTEELLLDREGGSHLIDNFLDEMLEFGALPSNAIKCFVLSFIEKACKKDAEVMKKAVTTLYYLIMSEDKNVQVIKKAMLTGSNIYSIVLRWAVQKKNDKDVESCWDKFSSLKGRIMFYIDNENEGIRTRAIKFLEVVVLAQSNGSEAADTGARRIMSLAEIPRDHRYISYRKMEFEAQQSMQSLIDQTSLPHISSQNLLTAISALFNIARQRPEFMSKVVDAIDVLQVNLPPTLGTSQVKAVRKELKMHLIRLMKHPLIVAHVQRISTLLSDLGASQAEIQKVMPAEVKRKPSAPSKEDEPAMKKRRDQAGPSNADADEDDEDDDEEGKPDKKSLESAIDVTQNFIFSRLNHRVVSNLVIISLATLPDVMPPAFQSTFTPIASAGSENQRMRLARMMATQANSKGLGPGAEMMKEQKLRVLHERAVARNEGAVIPPTPAHFLKSESGKAQVKRMPAKVTVPLPPPSAPTTKSKVQMNIVTSCKEMSAEERDSLFILTLERLMDTERRAQQGGAAVAQHKILVRLVSRFKEDNDHLELKLANFIVAQHKSRCELALLWVAEMYAQYQGFSLCFAKSHDDGRLTQAERLARYNKVIVLLLRCLFEKELHKETVFHKIFLEAPVLTPDVLSYLKLACTDPVFHSFAITTLRELVLARCRQRSDLLQLLFHLTFYEKVEIRTQSIETVKELFELPYMKNCVRAEVESQLDECTKESPPPYFIVDETGGKGWKPNLYKAALTLPMATLTHDHSLIHVMARVFAKSTSNDFKLTMMRQIENAVKGMGQGSEELLRLLEECPQGAESLVARIVHLLTERAPATRDIVDRLKKLHDSRQTDVRSLLPILPGLSKEDILKLLPKFVIHPVMAKSFGQAVKRILSAKNSESGQFSLSPTELIVEYHKIEAKTAEEKKLLREHVRTLMTSHRSMTKEAISSGIEELLREKPLPQLIFHTIQVVYELHNPLHAFLSNVLHKVITRDLWKENEEYEKDFFAAIVALADVSYQVALTKLNVEDVKKLMESTSEDVAKLLKAALPTLSTHQQKEVSDDVLELIGVSERPCEARERERKKDQKEREDRRDKDGRTFREGRGDGKERRRDRDEKRGGGDGRSSRRSYAIGDHR